MEEERKKSKGGREEEDEEEEVRESSGGRSWRISSAKESFSEAKVEVNVVSSLMQVDLGGGGGGGGGGGPGGPGGAVEGERDSFS